MFRKPQELQWGWDESTYEEVAEEERDVVKGHVSKGLLYWPKNRIGSHWIRSVS